MEITGEKSRADGRILRNLREMSHEERFEEAQWLRENREKLLAQGSREGDIGLRIAFLEDVKGIQHLMSANLENHPFLA